MYINKKTTSVIILLWTFILIGETKKRHATNSEKIKQTGNTNIFMMIWVAGRFLRGEESNNLCHTNCYPGVNLLSKYFAQKYVIALFRDRSESTSGGGPEEIRGGHENFKGVTGGYEKFSEAKRGPWKCSYLSRRGMKIIS